MSRWIRWWGFIAFAVLILLIWLLSQFALKYTIETAGSKALGAKVSVDQARIQWWPIGILISDLQVTNPNQTTRNWFVAERIQMHFDSAKLIRHQWIADEVSVTGIAIDTPRRSSGANEAGNADRDGVTFTVPGLDFPDVKSIANDQLKLANEKIDATESAIKKMQEQWQQTIKDLPDQEKINGYQRRWKEAKSQSVIEKLKVAKALKKDVDTDIQQIRSLRKQLSQDRAEIDERIQNAKALPGNLADQALQSLGLDKGDVRLSAQLVKNYLAPALTRLLAASGNESGEASSLKPSRSQGQWVHFSEQTPFPDRLIRHAKLSGVLPILGQPLEFSGEIFDLTDQPGRWAHPAKIQIFGREDNKARLDAKAVFDRRQGVSKTDMNFTMRDLAVSDYSVTNNAQMSLALSKANVAIEGQLNVNDDQVKGQLRSHFDQAVFNGNNKSDKKALTAVVSALESVKNFTVNADIGGSIDSPSIAVKSNLDNVLSSALKSQLQSRISDFQAQLTAELQQGLAQRLSALSGQQEALKTVDDQLSEKQSQLSELIKVL